MKSLPLLCGALALLLLDLSQGLRSTRSGPSAVTKVVTLLEELKARIEKDGEQEQQVYDRFACWCETITSKKAQAITSVRAEITTLGNKILELKGSVATTISEIKGLTQDIERNEQNQKTATEVRQRESASFMAEKTELQQALAALESAIAVLGEGTQATSLLNRPGPAPAVLAKLHAAISKLPAKTRPGEKRLAALGAAAKGGRYAPQSITVQGILHEMHSSFAGSLEAMTQEEGTAHTNYETLMATWQSELATLQDSVASKEQQKAEAETMLADSTQEYADSEGQLQADIAFFDATKASCVTKTDEWSARLALRTEELNGIAQALSILTSDAARQLFATAIQPGLPTLLQEAAIQAEAPLARARGELRTQARRSQSLRLAALAAAMGTGGRLGDVGHFDQVIQAIDTLLATLNTEEADDTKKVDDCKNQTQAIALRVEDLEWQITQNNATIQKHEDAVTAIEAEKAAAVAELNSIETEINESKALRVEENGQYLQAKSDDEQAIALLQQARDALSQYFANHSIDLGSSLLQQSRNSSGTENLTNYAPDTTFSSGGSRKTESKGIISILSHIIEDLEAEISHGRKAEESSQLDYERRLAASEALATQLRDKIINLRDASAAKSSAIDEEKRLRTENEGELSNQEQTKATIKPECDWFIAHQAERREKRALEVEGLRRAKEYLAGAAPSAMVQRPPAVSDDGSFAGLTFSTVSFLQRR